MGKGKGKGKGSECATGRAVALARTASGLPRWVEPLAPVADRSMADAVAATPMSLYGTDVSVLNGDAVPAALSEILRHGARTITASSLAALLVDLGERLSWDTDVAFSSGRWEDGEPDPERFIPGDVVALRTFILGELGRRAAARLRRGDVLSALWMACEIQVFYAAKSYFVPAECVDALVDAHPPAEELDDLLVLSAPITAIWFGKEVPFPSEFDFVDDVAPAHLKAALENWADAEAQPYGVNAGLFKESTRGRDGRLTGLVLFSDEDGHLEEEVLWVMSSAQPLDDPASAGWDRDRGLVAGYLSRSAFGGLARAAAATVAWGGWLPPTERLVMPSDPRARRRVVQTSSFRRKEPHGAVAGVRVLDAARTVPTTVVGSEAAGRAALDRLSPVPHWRKPDVRRYRIGPRDAWHYEERKIGRSRVMPSGPVRSGDVIWRIPRPEEAKRRRSA